MTNDQSDFTQGSILKKLVTFMMPVLGALILQAAYGAVDLLVVGRFGSTSGLSAVSTGTMGHFAFMAHLNEPPLNSPSSFPSLDLVPSGKIRKFLPAATSWLTC